MTGLRQDPSTRRPECGTTERRETYRRSFRPTPKQPESDRLRVTRRHCRYCRDVCYEVVREARRSHPHPRMSEKGGAFYVAKRSALDETHTQSRLGHYHTSRASADPAGSPIGETYRTPLPG